MTDRTKRLNSLLREVLSEVINREVKNPHVASLVSVTSVNITKDLRYAKVYISVIGTAQEKSETINALQSASGFISVQSSKKVVMRYFPELTFIIDNTADEFARINNVLKKIQDEKHQRNAPPTTPE